jgi:hypothetical protein
MKIDNSGQILLEVMVAMSIAAVVVVLGSQLIYVSLLGNKAAQDNDIASGLLQEVFAAVQASATENWNNVYSLTHGATVYYPQKSAGKWVLVAGTESVPLNLAAYSRFFTIQNVCRDINIANKAIVGVSDSSGSAITCNNISNSRLDPSTQKIIVTVSWPGGQTKSESSYLTRWRNKICTNTNWVGGKNYPTDNVFICSGSVNTYYNDDGNVDTSTTGAIKLKSS